MKKWWLWIPIAGLVMCMATVAMGAQPSEESLGWEQLEHEIWILERFHRLRLSADQCSQMAEIILPVIQQHHAFRQRLNAPEALALKQQQWQAALKGTEPGEDWEQQMLQLMGDEVGPGEQIEQQMTQAAQQILELLDDWQLRRMAETPTQELAIELMESLRQQRAAPPQRWQEWKQTALGEVVERLAQEGEAAATLQRDLGALFDRLYDMPTGEFFAQQEQIEQEMLATLELQGPPSREVLLDRGQDTVVWMFFEAPRPVYLLEQYAAAAAQQQ